MIKTIVIGQENVIFNYLTIPKFKDFTQVCTTEMIAFTRAHTYFKKLNTELLGLSVDSNSSHLAWMYDIFCKTGIKVSFPIIADRNGEIARKYGMISSDISNTETVRNVFIIDDKGIIRAIFVYPMQIGRAIPEILRTVQALQVADENSAMTPANWIPCEPIIMPPPQNFQGLQDRVEEMKTQRDGLTWYLGFKTPQKCIKPANEENN